MSTYVLTDRYQLMAKKKKKKKKKKTTVFVLAIYLQYRGISKLSFLTFKPRSQCPGSTPVRTGMKTDPYIVINRGTVPTKMIVTVLPLCSPGLVRGSTTVSPECPRFTTVKPGVTPVVYGGGWLVG